MQHEGGKNGTAQKKKSTEKKKKAPCHIKKGIEEKSANIILKKSLVDKFI